MTARALVVQHTASEGPGWLGEWLPAAGVELDVVRPHTGEALPPALDADALIVLGGPMGAYDDDAAPWLPMTRRLLAQAVTDSVPVLGICLGGQLLAAACGGRVQRGPVGPEIGVGNVKLRPPAVDDAIFSRLPPVVRALQWHYDSVTELPPGAVWLAESAAYGYQAFRLGARAWGLQFHVEAPASLVAHWARGDAEQLAAAGLDEADLVEAVRTAETSLVATWRAVTDRWAALVVAGQLHRPRAATGRRTGRG